MTRTLRTDLDKPANPRALPPLPVRRRRFVGPYTPAEHATIRAILASAAAQLPIPVRAWNGPRALLNDGTLLTHTPTAAPTSQTPTFIAHIPCPHGATHAYLIHTAHDLTTARTLTHHCQTPHHPTDQPKEHPQP